MIECNDDLEWESEESWDSLTTSCISSNETGCGVKYHKTTTLKNLQENQDLVNPVGGSWQCSMEKQFYSKLHPIGTTCNATCLEVFQKILDFDDHFLIFRELEHQMVTQNVKMQVGSLLLMMSFLPMFARSVENLQESPGQAGRDGRHPVVK